MKKAKKVLALLLAVALIVMCFAACGNKEDEKGTTSDPVLKIGASGPLTGGAALYGQGVKNGAELAVEEINAAGGINGVKIEFKMEDDEHNAEKAVNAYNALVSWGMQLSLGTVTSNPCIAFQGKALADNMFVLTPSATATEAIEGDNAFRVCFSDPNQGVVSADYIADNKVATKIAVIYDSSDAYSSGIYEKFAAEAKVKGLEVVTAQSFTEDSKTDFSAQIQAVKSSGAELVFLPIYYSEATLILKQAQTAGLEAKYFGCDGLDGILSMENFDIALAEGVMFLTPFAPSATDKYTVNFVKKYSEKYGTETMNQFAANAYDAIYIIKAAAEKAGITADMNSSDICNALKAAMQQITFEGVSGTGITWGADGEPSKLPRAVVIKNGAYEVV